MNENEYLAGVAGDLLDGGAPLVLASIVSLQGSSPRHNGTKMAVGADGKSYGTIGGSLLEFTAIKESRDVLAAGQSRFMDFDLVGSGAYAKGMICGGRATVLLDYIPATTESQAFFRLWREAVVGGADFYVLTHLKGAGNTVTVAGRSLLFPDGRVAGDRSLTPGEMAGLRGELHNVSMTSVVPVGEDRVVVDPIRRLKTVYSFGAGHVAVPTAHIASLAGFRVVVVDDRADFANADRFPDASEIRVIEDFNRALGGLEIDEDSFIVILTRGHQYDRVVLQQALETKAGYIGMISSRKKRDAIFQALMAEGVSQKELERVHSPIGIALGGETPEEIAVSIVAEMIKERVEQSA